MTEEEINQLKEANEAAAQRVQELERKVSESEATVQNVVEELKQERIKKREAMDAQNAEHKTDKDEGVQDTIEQAVERVLTLRHAERRKEDYEKAMEEFKQSKTEFQNDPSGLVFEKFKENIKMFNFTDLQSKEQIHNRLEGAYNFVNRGDSKESKSAYEGTPNTGTDPKAGMSNLTHDQHKVLGNIGMSEKRFNELKNKYPDSFNELGV